jgi:ferredoxin
MAETFRVALFAPEGAGGESFAAASGENLLVAAQRAHWLVRYGCRNGNCGSCVAILREGCVQQRGERIDASDQPREILLCQAEPRSDLCIDLPFNPRCGADGQARRVYAQIVALEPAAGGVWLSLQLPAGRQLPRHIGQRAQLETQPPCLAEICVDVADGRVLRLFCEHVPPVQVGDHVHLRYPLGFAYRIAPVQPLWVLHDAATRARAQRLSAWLQADVVMDMGGTGIDNPGGYSHLTAPVLIIALAPDADALHRWYAQLLAQHVRFTELRCDFEILLAWRVCRQDDNGNRFVMAEFLDEPQARAQAQSFAARGHKQLYWAEPMTGVES